MEDFNGMIIILSIFLLSIYIYKYNVSDYVFNVDIRLNDYFRSHTVCPVMGGETNYSACIHYPPLNLGFTISVYSIECLSEIQTSFKKNDGIYTIDKKDGVYYFNKGGVDLQIIKLCNRETIQELIDTIGTKKTLIFT
tara:strand:+ start:948 stop:1361 length:414 start_codon:yes stop_codon:yes gene_type:complete